MNNGGLIIVRQVRSGQAPFIVAIHLFYWDINPPNPRYITMGTRDRQARLRPCTRSEPIMPYYVHYLPLMCIERRDTLLVRWEPRKNSSTGFPILQAHIPDPTPTPAHWWRPSTSASHLIVKSPALSAASPFRRESCDRKFDWRHVVRLFNPTRIASSESTPRGQGTTASSYGVSITGLQTLGLSQLCPAGDSITSVSSR